MNVTIRLYKKQDLDLISLYQCPNFSLPQTIRTVVNACAVNEPIFIDLPNTVELTPLSQLQQCLQFHIIFSEEKDGEQTIRFLKNILPGYRNNFIKNLIRCYLSGMQMSYYFVNTVSPVTNTPQPVKEQKKKTEKKQRNKVSVPPKKENISPVINIIPDEKVTVISNGNHAPDNNVSGEMAEEMAEEQQVNPVIHIEMPQAVSEPDNNSENEQDEFDLFSSIENMLSSM